MNVDGRLWMNFRVKSLKENKKNRVVMDNPGRIPGGGGARPYCANINDITYPRFPKLSQVPILTSAAECGVFAIW